MAHGIAVGLSRKLVTLRGHLFLGHILKDHLKFKTTYCLMVLLAYFSKIHI